jgi:hypothetical protein
LKKQSDDLLTIDFVGVVFLVLASLMATAILAGNTLRAANLLVPTVFGNVGLIFLIGDYTTNKRIRNASN